MEKTLPPKMPNPFAPRTYGELQRVSERVWIVRNITNSSFVVGDRGVAVIDTQVNKASAERLAAFVKEVTDKPVLYVVNTHYHWDHTNGNALFKKQGAAVVSSKLTKEFMTVRAPRQKEFLAGRGFELGNDPLLPDETFEGETTLDLGGVTLRLFFAGKAESDDATAVWVDPDRVLMAGDTIMTGSFPIFGQPVWDEGLQGDGAWQEAVRRLSALDPSRIVPGHGPLATKEDVNRLLEIEDYFCAEVAACVKKGLSLERTIAELEPRLPAWMRGIPVVWGSPRYAILRVWRGLTRPSADAEPGWQKMKPSAVPSAPEATVASKTANARELGDYSRMAEEAGEGGDAGLKLALLEKAADASGRAPEALCAWAEALIDESRREPSVLEKGDFFSRARALWDEALARRTDHGGALLGKGRYLTMMAFRGGDDPSEGMRFLEKAAALSEAGRPRAEAEFYLGIGFRRLGDESQARERFRRALAFDPSFVPAALASQS